MSDVIIQFKLVDLSCDRISKDKGCSESSRERVGGRRPGVTPTYLVTVE